MDRLQELPLTPDFEDWPITQRLAKAQLLDGDVNLVWSNGQSCQFSRFFLAENDPAPECLHPLSREALISPLDLPEDLSITAAHILEQDILEIHWSHSRRSSRFHPGWLYAHGWFGPEPTHVTEHLWRADDLTAPPTRGGQDILASDGALLEWLETLATFGIARLEKLPNKDGLLEKLVSKIGPIRESNFGRSYTLEIKEAPDSNAFTNAALLQHMDMPTRECPHGLQFLYCRENTAQGGEGVYVDGHQIAADLAAEEPEHFRCLCETSWIYTNRSRTSSYQASGPVIERSPSGQFTGIRYTPWLRAPMKAPLAEQNQAYRAYRAFAARAQSSRYQLEFSYRPGDLIAFDNRRILHGRRGYETLGGRRFIEGIYADRDDLHSTIRTLRRNIKISEGRNA